MLKLRKFAAMALIIFGSNATLAQTNPPVQPPAGQKPPAKTAPQTEQLLPSYEGQNVASIEIAGQPDLDQSKLLPLLTQKAGQPFSEAKVNESAAALRESGPYKSVQVMVVPDMQGIRVLLILQPAVYFGMYRFPGALGHFGYSQLLQIANYPPQGPYTTRDVNEAHAALVRFFQRNGFFLAKVNPELQVDRLHGLVNVMFVTDLGRRARFGNVILEGATPDQSARLHGTLTSIMARLRGSAIRSGKKYSLKTIQNATQRLEYALMKQAHLNAKVKLIGANYDPESNRADISFQVTAGPKINVSVEGARLWSWTKRKLLPVYQQVGVDQEIIQEGQRNLVSHFQSRGYFDAKVTVNTTQEENGEKIVYTVTKGPRHKVSDVAIAGNHTLPDSKLMPSVSVKRARFFSHGNYSEELVRQSVRNLETVYRSEGFSTVRVVPEVTSVKGNLNVTFQVTEGPRDIVEALKISGNDTMPISKLAPAGLNVRPGQPYSQRLVNRDRANIMAKYLESGYLTATFRETVATVEKDPHRLAVTYLIHEGPRVIATNIVTIGPDKTRQSFIDKTVQLQADRPLTANGMLSAESRLYEPGIFDWAEVNPRRQITTQDREEVLVKVHEAKRHTIKYGFGFEIIKRGGSIPSGTVAVPGIPPVGLPNNFRIAEQTFYGPRGTFQYSLKNIRGRAETLTVGGLAGRLTQSANITFENPHFRESNWVSDLSGTAEHDSSNPIFTTQEGIASYQLHHSLNKSKTTNLFFRYSYQDINITRLLAGFEDLVPPEDRNVRLSIFSVSYIRDTRDNILDARKGSFDTAEFGVNSSALGSNVNFVRFFGQAAYYKELPRVPNHIIWANSLRLGLEQPFAGSFVPLQQEFFSGGGSTLRGFPLDGAGPQRTITICGNPADPSTCALTTVPVGGNALLILNSEFRIPVPIKKGLGVVGFYDGGNVFPTASFNGQYTNSVGFGVRYATPVGPIRVDIGHLLNRPPSVGSIQYFITLGQAF